MRTIPNAKKPLTLKRALAYVLLTFFILVIGYLISIAIMAASLTDDVLCSPDLNGGNQNVCES